MARRIEQTRWNRYGKLPSELNVLNRNLLTYKMWLNRSGVGNGNGTLDTYNAWNKGVDPTTYKAK